jgi:asparagine synthase (glutamine-hydrolysing)
MADWLRAGSWKSYFRSVLLDRTQTTFDHHCVARLFDGQTKGRSNEERLFGLLMFELWRREYRIELQG